MSGLKSVVNQVSMRAGVAINFFILMLVALSTSLVLHGQTTFAGQIGVEVADRPTGFVDAFKDQGRLFINASTGNPVPTDANGNPLSDGIAVVFDNRPVPAWTGTIDDPSQYQPDCAGTYQVSFQGQATLSNVSGAPTLTFANQTYNAATNTTTVSVTLPGGTAYAGGQALMEINFTNTQLTPASGTDTGIAGLQVIRPNMPAAAYTQKFGQAGLTANGQIFDPAFVTSFAPFGYLRFMGWLGTNSSPGYFGDTGHHLLTWSTRSLPTDFYQGVGNNISSNSNVNPGAWGVSWEYVLLLANATNKDIWINIPISATGGSDPLDPTYDPTSDSYIYQLALLLKNGDAFTGNVGLNPGLHVYIEHSNEVWNSGFLQYTWNLLAAEDEVNQGGSVLNNDGDANQYDWAYRRHIKRLYEIGQIFEQVFGAGSLNTTIRPVYAWWQLDEGPSSNAANALAWFAKTYGPPSNYFYAMAQADYFDTPNYATDTTIPEVLSDMQSASNSTIQYVQQGVALAKQYGMPLFAYEGGPASDNEGAQSATNVGIQILANRDPGMDTLVQHHIGTNWFENGGSNYGYFGLSSAYSRYGDWGATDDYRNLTTSKYNALVNLTGYTVNGVPFSPGDLQATGGNQQVLLSWETVPSATSYNIERAPVSGGPYTVVGTVTSSTYSDANVTNGATYYYFVTASNSSGQSTPSNEAGATPESAAPAPPSTLTATGGNTQATLTWTAAAGATSYNVYEGTTSGAESSTPIATGITNLSYTVTGLTNGTAYYFEVAGVNSLGTGAVSTEASATAVGPPPAPTDLTATSVDGQVSLAWSASTGATSYNVYEGSAAGGENSTPVATGVTATSYTVSGLTDGDAYYFKVAAVNGAGVSSYSNEAGATPAPPSALLAYEPFGETVGTVLNGNSGGGDFGWGEAWSDQNGHGDVPGFDVASANPVTYPGLVESGNYAIGGDSYDYIGRQLNVSAAGPFSAYLSNGLIGAPGQTVWLSFVMREDEAGATPSFSLSPQGGANAWWISSPNIQIGYLGSTSNDASGNPFWSIAYGGAYATPTATVLTNSPVVVGQPTLFVMSVTFGATGANSTVNLYVNPTSLGGSAPSTPSATYTTTNSLAFQSLTYYGGTGYNTSSLDEIRVGATYAAVTPAATTLPAAPTSLTATAGNGQATLSWTGVAGATSYNIYEGTTAGGESATPVATGISSTSYTVSNLANGTTYYFVVAAVNSIGASAFSNEANTTPVGPPPAPAGLTATAGDGEIALAWTASSGATSYNVYQGGASGGESATPIATGVTATSYTVSGLTNGTAYYFTVAAVSAAGTSGYSNQASATAASSGNTGTLLAYEQFGESGTAPFALNGASGGGDQGWSAAWVEQNGSTTVPGYNIASANPLTYAGLVTTTDYATGGYQYQGAGRPLNVSAGGPFTSYLSNGLIGAPGQTVWISFLLRQDSGGATPYVGLTAEGGVGAWWMNPANIELGYFGSSSNNSSGNPMWSLQYNGATVLTNVPMVTGQTALFVVEDTFGSNGSPDQINVYVNPTSLGGSAPSTPNLQYSPSGSTAFQSITYYGGNNSGQSSLGDIRVGTTYATVTPAAAVTPAAPTGLTATAGNGQVTLAWTGATGATSYNVYEGASSGGESATPIATGVTSTSFTVQGLTNGSAYYFEVAAVNANGTSSDSNEASATPFAPLTPPTGLSATAGDSQASLSWTGVTGAASYNVYQGVTSGGESGTPVATGITTATYTATGLSNGTTYFFTVTAVNSNGVSAASNEASATPAAAGTLLAYEPFGEAVGTVLNGNSGGGDFGWSEAWSDQNGHGDVPGFDVASANPIYYPGIVESANYAIGGDSYDYVGRQLNTSASGPFASYLSNGLIGAPGQTVWLSFLMREDAAGTTPSFSLSPQGGTNAWWISSPNIQIGYLGSTSNDASGNPFWSIAYGGAYATPTATVLTNAPVVAGQPTLFVMSVTFGATGANSTVNLYVNPTSLGGAAPSTPSATYTTTNSLAFQSLTYYGGTGYNTSSLDEIRVGTTYAAVTPATPVTIPSSPTSLTATAGSGAVSLAWSAVTGATSYDIYQGTTAGSENPTPVATGITGTTYTVANLANGTTYYFVVAAANSAGTGTYSNEASATPSVSAGIPAAPVLTAAAGNLQATLSWTTSTGATSYNVYQGTTSGGEGTTPIATGVTGNTYTAAGLSNETTYFFEVTATNSAGTSKVSNEASVTPAPPVSGTNAPASFSIFPQVVAANPVNAGFNMQPAAGANITENAWIADGGFAPYDERMSFTASQNGTATTFIASGGGGTSFYSSITTGYFVGATARTYRYSNGAWSLLRTDTVADYTALDDTSAADNTITFASSGPQILAGDIVWLDLDDQQTVPGLTLLDPRFTEYCANWGTEAQGSCDSRTKTLPYTLSTDVPASDTGGLSMELSDGSSENQGIWQYVQGAFVGPSYEQFQPGHTYKVDVWLKQSGIGNGSVTFSINGMGISHTFTDVTDTWQEFTWTFPAVAGLPANSVQPSVHLDYTAPGTMWVDNFKLYDAAWAPNAVDPEVMTTWQNYQPGTVRIWSNFGNASENYSFFSLDSWLTPEIKTRNTPGVGNQYEVPGELEHLPDALANVKTIGANPWLIVNMALSEVEWGELIDYLAAPAGVGYAAKRPADHPGPYTDDFSTIYLEVGNEEWGTQQVPADAAYGQWAHFVIGNAIAGKSYFNPSQLKFILNGFDLEPSFGSAAAAAAPEASMVDAALYTQGNQSLTGDAYYQSDLVQVPASNGPIIDSIVSQQQLDAANGRIYGLAAYEEGPGADTPTHSSDNSLAAGIGAIDVNLYASLRGFGPQNLFMYGLGSGPYTSHTNFANGFRPHPVWEALQMRNNYCTGPMVLTTTNSVPTTTDGNNYPLIAVYTFQDAKVTNQADVVVISRDLNNQTPVTLNFPATPTGSANLYMLTGDPRADNNEAMNTPITTTTLDGVTSSYTFTMPPGSMYVFQVPLSGTWSSSGQPTPPPPTGLLANPGNGEVTLTWAASNGATSYNVLRGSTTGGPYTQIGTTAQVAYTDSAVTNGANYYYVVQAVNGGGASSNSAEVSATPNVEDASMATVAPPLDGSDTGAWANVPFIPLPHSFDGNSTDTAAYKILWDNNNLYVLVSVQDSYLVAPTQANIYEGEAVELYFSGTDTRSTKYGPTDFQYAFPYGNGGAVVTETYHSPASLTGVQFGQQNIAGGYQMVMELPWTTLGTTPVLNQQYGFDVMIDTASAQGTLLGKLGWWATVNDTWNNPSLMGPLVLTQPTTTAQTVSFTAPSSATYGSTLSLSATASSGLAPTYSLVSGPATLNGNELTFTGLGSVVVQASQAGNNTYSAATPVSQTIAVTAAPLTVSADNLSRVYGAANPTFTGSVNGGVNGDAFTETFATTATTSSTVGAYNIVPSVTGANLGNYNVTIQDGTLTITQATPTINWAAPHAITYGTALSATQLNATSSTAGLLTYTPALGAVPNAGSQTLSVVLSPTDGTDYAKASASVQLTVNKAPTTLSLSANPNPAVQGKATLITASVTGSGQPSGTVIITSGSTTLCKASLGATGTATCSYTPTASGSFAIAASYAGDSNHLGSSGSLSLSVFDTSVTEQFSSVQLVYPGATNVTVCVAGATKATGTGTVEIEDGSTVLTTQSLQGNGCAYWYISPGLSAGAHIISSVYSGDKNNPAGASQPTTLNVSAVPVKMSASCWNSTFAYGANYQCTVNVSSNAGSALGSISYSFDGGAPVAVPLSSGNAGFTITKPLAGNHTIAIGYAQQTNYAAATTQTDSFTVTPAPITLSLTPSTWYTTTGTSIVFQAAVSSWSAGAPDDNGSISFYDGSTLLATVPVNSSGAASYSTASLPVGSDSITATYAGGANYASGSTSVTITIVK